MNKMDTNVNYIIKKIPNFERLAIGLFRYSRMNTGYRSYFSLRILLAILISGMGVIISCEPLATRFPDIEDAILISANNINPVPDTFSVVKVMTWNIRFGAGRRPWFGDACGDHVIFTKDEIYQSLQEIVDKINEIKPDILLLQEVDVNSKRSGYIDELRWIMDHSYFNYAVYGAQWQAQFIPSDGLGRLYEVNAIFSRWGISDAKRIQLDLRTDQDKLTVYFYERCCMVTGKINIPHLNNLYGVNIHASAFATDETKHNHIIRLKQELDRIHSAGGWFIAGGDFNTIPPGSDSTDYCLEDMCPGESYHHSYDNPYHKDGSNYEPEKNWLNDLYASYKCAVPLEKYQADQEHFFSHTTRPDHFWDRTLDYLFTNYHWVENSGITHQDATTQSDHAPVSAMFVLPK
jgi:endonuclease/exonuclease/phosphatase family metal-dependent hydrolase